MPRERFDPSPEFKGIKTGFPPSFLPLPWWFDPSPEFKGIKTAAIAAVLAVFMV